MYTCMHVKTLVLPLSTYAHGAGTVATTGISVLLLVVLVHLPVYVIVANGKSCSQLVLLHEKRLDLANSSYIHLHSAPCVLCADLPAQADMPDHRCAWPETGGWKAKNVSMHSLTAKRMFGRVPAKKLHACTRNQPAGTSRHTVWCHAA